ncbi:MAG: GNAT family N-acetyltransferase [Bacteroidetes bacterium]|nr:GNAT family N-acetyltransferase [Bacteroidota bacterium]
MGYLTNEDRLRQLAVNFFYSKEDPFQLHVTDDVIYRLRLLHPASVGEERTTDGPIAWTLVIPTTVDLMSMFLNCSINEHELYVHTPSSTKYTAVYLCSAIVLPEYRRKGIAKRLITQSVQSIQNDNPLEALFVWAFSLAGEKLAHSVARECKLPLYLRKKEYGHDHQVI